MQFLAQWFGNVVGDISILLLLVGIALGIGFFFGRTKLLSILMDVYIARAFVAVIPESWLAVTEFRDVIIFGIIFGFLFLVDQRLLDIHLSNRESKIFWRLGVMSVLVASLVVSSVLSLLPKEAVEGIVSPAVYGYFTAPIFVILWMALPLCVLLFVNRRI